MIEEEKLAEICTSGNVYHEPSVLDRYSRDISFVPPVTAKYVVKPGNAAEIEKIVKLANEKRTPLVPVSSGAPHFRGDTVPGAENAVIIDLSGLKKIIRVDGYHRVAMVEPGVTFGELIPAAAQAGLRLNMPLLPRASKSVVGSMLEREPVMMPGYHWDSSDPLACVEIVFGSGDVFRTGQAAGPGTIEEQWAAGGAQKTPYGPGPAQWHRLIQGAQGTMGIVTWASLRCELLPKLEEPYFTGSDNLNALFEMCHHMIRLRLVNECLILNNVNLASIMADKYPDDCMTLKSSLPRWILFFTIAGYEYFPEERIASHRKGIQRIADDTGTRAVRSLGGLASDTALKVLRQPSTEPYWKLRSRGACQDIFYITPYSGIEGQIRSLSQEANRYKYPVDDIGIYIQPVVQGTSCHCEFNLFYDPQNKREAAGVRNLTTAATKSLMNKGAFFSRPYGTTSTMIMNRDHTSLEAIKKIKKILDPGGIMNPGKLCL
jgi:FAD/FMN-containing dehydrogenase